MRHRERELCGFIHDRYTIESDSVQLMCTESRLEEGSTFAQRVDFGVVDGNDLMETIMNRMASSVCLSGSNGQTVSQNREFERYANVEILEFVYTVIRQTEEDLKKLEKSSKLTMFLDDKTEMVGAETKPNELGMECVQTYGSLPCGRVEAPRCGTDSDYVGCALTKKSILCWAQGVRSVGDAESEFRAAVEGISTLLDAKSLHGD